MHFAVKSQQTQQKPASEETGLAEPRPGIDPGTSILPRWRSTTELSGQQIKVYGTVHLFDKCRVSVLRHVCGGRIPHPGACSRLHVEGGGPPPSRCTEPLRRVGHQQQASSVCRRARRPCTRRGRHDGHPGCCGPHGNHRRGAHTRHGHCGNRRARHGSRLPWGRYPCGY